MTQTTRTIFEKYEIRKTKKQKTAFIQWVVPYLQSLGYPVTVEQGKCGVRNIVIGDIEQAKVVFTAHYDTCAVLPIPNFITPKSFLCYAAYQILIIIAVLAVLFGIVVRALQVGGRSVDDLGSFICAGFAGAMMAQIFVNVGMNLCVLPVIGVTLPFYSAGGSSAWMMYLCVGLVLSVYMHNKKTLFGNE